MIMLIVMAFSAHGQALVRIHSPAVVAAATWNPASNPRQHERIAVEGGRSVLIRITDYE
jgi:hypothetical protein